MKLFGFRIERDTPDYLKKDSKVSGDSISFIDPDADSTAAVLYASPMSSAAYVDVSGTFRTEAQLITKYRDMSAFPEVDNAISEIVNEAIITDKDYIVKLDLDDVDMEDNSKDVIMRQFKEVLKLLDLKNKAYDIFKRWYVDGRLYYHVVIDPNAPRDGIKELRYIDPRKIREVREIEGRKVGGANGQNQPAEIKRTKLSYYLYNDAGYAPIGGPKGMMVTTAPTAAGIRISKDAIVHVPSGLTDVTGSIGISHLHKAMKILNELKVIEDSLIIYRLSRAPERRVWQVDVGSLPPRKAEEYLKKVADLQKNRMIFDTETGTMRDDRKFMAMTEDFWLPKRADGVGTSVTMLQGGANLGNIEDVMYFQKLLYNSLNVPVDRLQADTPFAGNTQEISRAEIKFNKFIVRLRQGFQHLFLKVLERHLVLKGLMTIEEFQSIESDIRFTFARDEHFSQLIEQQIRGGMIQEYIMWQQSEVIGKYVSNRWVRSKIFGQTGLDIEQMNKEIIEEANDPLYAPKDVPGDDSGSGEDGIVDSTVTAPKPQHGSASGDYYDKQHRIENAKHVVNALSSVKEKNDKQKKDYMSAVQIIARNQKK